MEVMLEKVTLLFHIFQYDGIGRGVTEGSFDILQRQFGAAAGRKEQGNGQRCYQTDTYYPSVKNGKTVHQVKSCQKFGSSNEKKVTKIIKYPVADSIKLVKPQ
jgi:hypothetical protein